MPSRAEMWKRLGEPVDLLVVGGGINGAGIARDAARRGLRVALIEKGDLASGTSSRSSKLIHGGLRYLEQYEFSLVFEAVSERRILMDLAPHLVNPLGFLFPVYADSRHKLWFINAGMWLYDGLSLFRSPKVHRRLRAEDIATEEPCLKREDLKGAPLYFDCATDDARLTLENAVDAAMQGAVIATWAQAERFLRDADGTISGVVVRDVLGEGVCEVSARVVVNATGPWTDLTLQTAECRTPPLLRPTKGVHIVVDREKLPLRHAVVCFHPEDERVLFAIPWGDQTYLGTTDTDFEGDPGDARATAKDVEYLIRASNAYFPEHPLQPQDVFCTWAGVRPLMAQAPANGPVDESSVSREHRIVIDESGLITIAGGKLTTYRRMSEEVVDNVIEQLELRAGGSRPPQTSDPRTERTPLPGGLGWPSDDDHERVAAQVAEVGQPHLAPDVARNLADTYGMRALDIAAHCVTEPSLANRLVAGRPEIMAQVDWAVKEEFAATVSDVMARRTPLFYRDHDQGLAAAEEVARHMGALLGWEEATAEEMTNRYREEVARSREWATE